MSTTGVGMGRVGIWSNPLRYHDDRGAVTDAAAELEGLGYGALWLPDVGGDVLGDVDEVLGATRAIPVATGILNIWMHPAAAIAAGVADLERRRPGRFLLGLGASHAAVVDAGGTQRYDKPLSAMRDYLDALAATPEPVPAARIVLAALRPRMLGLARERTGGAHPYLVPVSHTREARALLGPGRLLAPELSVVLDEDVARGRERGRAFLADYLTLPNYVRNLATQGFEEHELTGHGSDRLLDAVVAVGDEAAIARRVAEHLEAGADHVCVQVVGEPAGTLTRASWRRLAPALTGL
jgi:probable F420-dependent oxidoreductase